MTPAHNLALMNHRDDNETLIIAAVGQYFPNDEREFYVMCEIASDETQLYAGGWNVLQVLPNLFGDAIKLGRIFIIDTQPSFEELQHPDFFSNLDITGYIEQDERQ